eukprot:TRINITY_DN10579_c0_g1_i1.p1 TRINITY_DN10579_c0_g1~~TRINITY_DN10579_c0_g1_i1.p1  ORF type:complete len:385 (-),score=78.28 TRINITY_DN10579_c0_g1_i1:72-1226(-)
MITFTRICPVWILLGVVPSLLICFGGADATGPSPPVVDPSIQVPSQSSQQQHSETLVSSNDGMHQVGAETDRPETPPGLPVVSATPQQNLDKEPSHVIDEFNTLAAKSDHGAENAPSSESNYVQTSIEEAPPMNSVENKQEIQDDQVLRPEIIGSAAVPVSETGHQSESDNVNQNNDDATLLPIEQTVSEQVSPSGETQSRNAGDFENAAAADGTTSEPFFSPAMLDATKPGATCSREVTFLRGDRSNECFLRQLNCLHRLGLLPDDEGPDEDDEDYEGYEDDGYENIPTRDETNMRRQRAAQAEEMYEFDGQAFETQAVAVSSIVYLWPGLLTALMIIAYNHLQLKYNLTPLTFQSTFVPSVWLIFITSCSLLGWIFITSLAH